MKDDKEEAEEGRGEQRGREGLEEMREEQP